MRKRILSLFLIISIVSSFMVSSPIVASAETIASGTCGDNLTWTLDSEGTLTINGSGNMDDYVLSRQGDDVISNSPWDSYRNNITMIVINEGVTTIGNGAFFSFFNLENITIANTVNSVGENAFSRCENLINIVLPQGLSNIGDSAFSGCKNMKEIVIPNNVSKIGAWAFNSCTNLLKATLPNKLTTISNYIFSFCYNLESVNIPDGVIKIEYNAFDQCYKLNDVTIPNTVTIIENTAFSGCRSLERIQIPNKIISIEDFVFLNCKSLTDVILSANISTIGYGSFGGCPKLSDIHFSGNEDNWNNIEIDPSFYSDFKGTIHYNYSETQSKNIKLGDYVQMGKYYGEPILWRCVAFEKISGYDDNGNPIMDATDTVTEYQEGYLPLMLSDKILCLKPFDAAGTDTSGSHGRGYYYIGTQGYFRQSVGSDYWADSNMRCWLNSTALAGKVLWTCGNPPNEDCVQNGYNEYDDEAGFLINFTQSERSTMKIVTQKSLLNGYEYSKGSSNTINSDYHRYNQSISNVVQNYDAAFSENVTDTMFLLDVKQVNEVYNNSDVLGSNYYIGELTLECVENSEFKSTVLNDEKKWYYWLRTSAAYHNGSDAVRYISWNGDVDSFYVVNNSEIGVRPAFFLESTYFENFVGSGTESNPFIIKDNYSKPSNSTSTNAPVIKSVELEYNNTCYDIVNQKVTVDVGSSEKANLTVNMDLKSALKPRVYITQGAETDLNDGNGMSLSFNNTDGKWKDITLGEKLKPDLPVYIFVIDEITGQSTSMRTKLNMVDLSADDDFKKAKEIGEIKIGKDMMLTIPEDVPIIGGTELTWQFDFLPVSMTCADDKMSFALGLDIADYNDGSDKDKKEGFDFKSFKETIDDYAESLSEYDGNIADAYNEQKKSLSQIKKEVLSKSDLAKNKGLNMSVFDNKPFVNTGADKLGGGIEALGYVEVNKENGEWNWNGASGYLLFQVKVSYTYNGQAFFYVIPLCYSFGGEASAGFKGEVKGMSQEGYQPYIEAYLMAKLKLFVSGGVGVSKVANFSAKADADLSFNYGLTDTAVKPDELLLDGSVGFFVEMLGQKVASLEVANLNDKYGVIYSTDPNKYDQSWIKPNSASAVSLMSIDEQLGNYSANNVYENESRDYLANSMEWYGDMPPISLFAADYTNKNLTILADSVYPEAQPQISSINGKKILVFTTDNGTRTADNKQMLVYSVYNDEDGTWSNAVPVADDGTADFYPSVSGEYLVWQNQKSVMGEGLSLAEIGKQGEIVIAKWNGNGFDAPVSLTDNDALDTLPKVSVNNNEISVVWLKNSADDILGVDGNTSIVKKVYTDSAWGEEIVLKNNLNAVTDLSVGYSESALNVAYVHDVDDDITTINDREIYLIGSSERQITDNEVLDSNAIINNGKLYWYSENNIHFMNLADGVKSTVFEDARYTLADGFTVSEENGSIAILWSGSEDNSSEIKGVLYQGGDWGDVITVSELGAYAKYPTCVLEEDGTILTSFTAEADGITSLYTLGLFPSYDLAISDIYFDEKNLALNSENEFEVMVSNNGELPVEGYTINVYNEDETLNNSIVFEDTIKAGESKAVVGKFITGDAISYETLKIEIALNADEEYVYDNNSVTLSIGNGDISIESLSVYEMLPTSYVVADVKNIGHSDISNITVDLRKDSNDGEIVQSKTVSSLTAGSNEEVTFAYKPQDHENVKWFITIEVEADEVSVGNNYDYFINECAVGLEDYEISILNYSYTDKQLTVNAFARNNTNDALTADAVFAVYSSDGRLKGIKAQPLSVGGYSDTGIDVWFENCTYASGDYVKMFMWSDLTTTLRPLVNAEQIDIVIE